MTPKAQFIGKTPSAVAKAGKTLQWLVKFAEAQRIVTYGELSKIIQVNWRTVLPRVLGVIGHSLQLLSPDIPPIQLLVVNQKTKIPGRWGLLGFLIKDKELLERLSLEDRRYQWEVAKAKVFDWKWREVLDEFGLEPLPIGEMPLSELQKQVAAICSHGGVEQEGHLRLKKYVASHPGLIGLKYKGIGLTEYTVLSGDRLDVFFDLPEQWVCVEVKGEQSPQVDILRGMFQCVKYRAVLEAQRHYTQNKGKVEVRVVLVLANQLPGDLEFLKALLDLEVIANVSVPNSFVVTA